MNLLQVRNLQVFFDTPDGRVTAVDDLSFKIETGEVLGIVGESGSGKSMTAFSLMGLLPHSAHTSGVIQFQRQNLLTLSEPKLNRIRADKIAIVFQNPMTSLNPYMKIGHQLAEVLTVYKGMSQKSSIDASIKMLDAVKIPQPRQRMSMYPFELSGGMRQRVMIAMALLCHPDILIADEPTTALDATTQSQIAALLQELRNEFNTAIIMITHDLALAAQICDNILVMKCGQAIESGTMESVFNSTSHSYTQELYPFPLEVWVGGNRAKPH